MAVMREPGRPAWFDVQPPTFEGAPLFPELHNRRKTDQPAGQAAPMKAHEFLDQAGAALKDRAASRDRGEERSMARCVAAFNEQTGHQLSETDGWIFMVMLKIARHYSGDKFNPDDFIDGAAYMGLGGECEARKAA